MLGVNRGAQRWRGVAARLTRGSCQLTGTQGDILRGSRPYPGERPASRQPERAEKRGSEIVEAKSDSSDIRDQAIDNEVQDRSSSTDSDRSVEQSYLV